MIEHLALRAQPTPPHVPNTPPHPVGCEPGLLDAARRAWRRVTRPSAEACRC